MKHGIWDARSAQEAFRTTESQQFRGSLRTLLSARALHSAAFFLILSARGSFPVARPYCAFVMNPHHDGFHSADKGWS